MKDGERHKETTRGEKFVEKLKDELLSDLRLIKIADKIAHWNQVPWSRPNPVQLAAKVTDANRPTVLAFALSHLPPTLLKAVSEKVDPFGCLLDAVNVSAWGDFCVRRGWPWMSRVWLATASQLRAEAGCFSAAQPESESHRSQCRR